MKRVPCLVVACFASLAMGQGAVSDHASTFCNPLDIAYGYAPHPRADDVGPHRATADPVIVPYNGRYYLFCTNQEGYWWSEDLLAWTFVRRSFLTGQSTFDDLCAPAVWVQDNALHVYGSRYEPDMPIWRSRDPVNNAWEQAIPALNPGVWDPAFFVDDDGSLYLYHGSSNDKPIWGVRIDPLSFARTGDPAELIRPRDDLHGWERFGEANDNTWLRPFVEGAWMTKHNGRYYLQWGGPGTEQSGYADGVYVGDKPLGPFEYQPHNPFSYKPGGFARGAGHGATFTDAAGRYWHTSTIMLSVKNNFERRIGLWPAGFDADGVMWCNTAYGDFPHRITPDENGSFFTGWMILNHAKPVRVSSTLGGRAGNFAVDEDLRTYWSAATGNAGEWIESDLGAPATLHAVQINYADEAATLRGRHDGLEHRYILSASEDGAAWRVLADTSAGGRDSPHAYLELAEPVRARFLRLENVHVPSGAFAISGLRAFGRMEGPPPATPDRLEVFRGWSEPRNAWIRWKAVPEATGYVLRAGIVPGKLYTSVMVLGGTDTVFRAMSIDQPYYFSIEAFNESGISAASGVLEAPVPDRPAP